MLAAAVTLWFWGALGECSQLCGSACVCECDGYFGVVLCDFGWRARGVALFDHLDEEIKPSVLSALKGKTGKTGPAGPAGAAGERGPRALTAGTAKVRKVSGVDWC